MLQITSLRFVLIWITVGYIKFRVDVPENVNKLSVSQIWLQLPSPRKDLRLTTK